MLYFYSNSNEISTYLNNSLKNFGNYNFKKYLLDKDESSPKKEEKIENNVSSSPEIQEEKTKEKNIILRLIKRIKSTDYFFLISPIHFKISVKHQDIPFDVILRFNGFTWKIQKIKMPYKELVEIENFRLK